ncbi:MAG: elongation factor T [Parcubacteria group bacterium Athens1014_10]|nr:MAG: elongation factor T [Parcubacteria group bacterium Athens1014_10]TSD06076.1 MAG: elongation factor T [Parcubacteria group bacterium Athens0714_12]
MISAETIKQLREKTGAAILDCKNALEQAGGDIDKAIEILRKQGQKIVEKKSSRTVKEGLIGSYMHSNNKIASLIEVNCETDFVARNEEFKKLVHNLAMQVVAANPKYLSLEDIPAKEIEKEKEIYKEQLLKEGKPENMLDKIMQGKLQKYYQEVCLLKQPFIKEDKITIEELIKQAIAKLGENIQVKRFVKFSL